MKKLIYISSIALILGMNSCSKEEDLPIDPLPPFRANVEGAEWIATEYAASIYQGTITVEGTADDGSKITLNLSGDTLGIYSFDENSVSSATYTLPGAQGKKYSTAGSTDGSGGVTIDNIGSGNKWISGSFGFIAGEVEDEDYITVVGGAFSEIPVSNVPVGSDNNTMSMMLSSENWAPSKVSGYVAFETLTLTGLASDGTRKFSFELPEDISPGKYTLNYFTKYKCQYTNSSGTQFFAVTGELDIESHNLVTRNIKGTYNVKLEDHLTGTKINVTEGEFNITYE